MKLTVIFAFVIVVMIIPGCLGITHKSITIEKAEIEFFGVDTIYSKDMGMLLKQVVALETAIEEPSMLKELLRYRKWKSSPCYKTVNNAEIVVVLSNNDTLRMSARIYKANHWVTCEIKNKIFCKKIPAKLFDELYLLRSKIPHKEGVYIL